MKVFMLVSALVALAAARSLHKRNAYGDEQVTPAAPAEAPVEQAPAEQAPVAVEQPAPDCAETPAPAVPSGYRSKRNANSYGDEQVTPAAPAEAPVEQAPAEQAPVAVEQPAPDCAETPAPAVPSGYRSKRNANSYGDEQVTPAAPAEAPVEQAPAEQAPVAVEQPAPDCAETPAPAVPSGYRSKRNANSYGDEQVTPAAPAEAPVEQAPAEQAPVAVEQPAPDCAETPAPAVPSGYRSKRNANSYGDEQVTPAAPAEAPVEQAPAEQAPVAVEQPAPDCAETPAPAVPSGYRSKRNANSYGDEQVTPAAPAEAPVEQAPAEQAPVAVEQPAPDCAETPAPAVPSGYRSKRNANSYGDEQVTPAAPAEAPVEQAPAEQAPVAVEQPAPDCAETPAPAVPSGYRSKRNANSYGDEQVTPAAPAEAPVEQAPAEQAPVAVEQPAPDCAETPAPAVPSGYRSKRSANSYGDEQVTPAPVEAPVEQTLVEQAPVSVEQPAPLSGIEPAPAQPSGY